MDDRLAGYRGLVESIAVKMAASKRALVVGAEYDDLVQEGWIAVWLALEDGTQISSTLILNAMRDYLRAGARVYYPAEHRAHNPIPTEEMLPIDDNIASP